MGLRNWRVATVTARRPSLMSAGGTAAADAALVAAQVFHRAVGDRVGERTLFGWRREELRLRRIGPEPDLDEHGRHECRDEDAEPGLLDAATRTGMDESKVPLHDSGKIGRLAQVFV